MFDINLIKNDSAIEEFGEEKFSLKYFWKILLSLINSSGRLGFFFSGGAIKSGICLWVPRLVTKIPKNIRSAAIKPYSAHNSGFALPPSYLSSKTHQTMF